MPDLEHDKAPSWLALEMALGKYVSNLWGAIRKTGPGGVYLVSVRLKSEGVWVALAKRYEPGTTAPQIAFGTGTTFGGALAQLNRSVSRGEWKVDRPYRQ